MPDARRYRGRWAAALLAGLLLRALFVATHPRFVGDTLVYGDLAHNLLAHHQYGLTEEGHVRATLIRLPGYPLFLAVCFLLFGTGKYVPVLWVQVAVDLLGCALLGMAAERLWGRRAGLVCVWLAALCPFTANYAAAALTETLSIFCVVLAFWGLLRWRERFGVRWAVVVGLALSGAVLLRPDGVLLSGAVLPAMGWIAWREGKGLRGRWWRVGLAAGCVVICLGVWTLRNWRVFHVLQPLAPKYANDPGEPAPRGFARWYRTWGVGLGNTARVYWEYDGSELSLSDLPPWAFDSAAERQETAAIYRQYNEDSSSTPAVEGAFARLARQRERAHRVRSFVLLPLARLGDMWLRPRTELLPKMPVTWWKPRRRPRATVVAVVLGTLNLLLLATALAGLWRWGRAGWAGNGVMAAAMVGYVVLRSVLLLTIDNSEPRYVLEGYPVVLLLAAVAIGGEIAPQTGSLAFTGYERVRKRLRPRRRC